MKVITALTGAAVALAAIPLTMQRVDLNRLLEANRALCGQAAQAQALQTENEELSRLEPDVAELERLRGEHLELLRLRGEIGVLRADGVPSLSESSDGESSSEGASAGQTLLEPVRVLIPEHQMLAIGGWATLRGERSVLTVDAEPLSEYDSVDAVRVTIRLLEASESTMSDLGLGDIRCDNPAEPVQRLLNDHEQTILRRKVQADSKRVKARPELDGIHQELKFGIVALEGRQTKVSLLGRPSEDAQVIQTTVYLTPTKIGMSLGDVEMTVSVQQALTQLANSAAAVPFLLAAPK